MPVYEFKCENCESIFEVTCLIKERNEPRACPECSSENTERVISLCSFVLKGDGWPGKNLKVRSQMQAKNRRLDSKKRDMKGDGMIPQLAPNVGGERTDSWDEAKKLAASKGKDTSSYEPYVQKEKKTE
ncbi:MAG: hypothetical protein GF334_07065 [Candidatus Altiarchaeales archaeon]|nr:hypothetical protein [Candidatus Altiarchaeales archaeon]